MERNFGRILKRTKLFRDKLALGDLETGYRATYAEHLARIEQLGGAFSSLDIAATDRVAVLADASRYYLELWHCSLAGNFIICPINGRFARDELIFVINDSGSRVLVIDQTFADVVDQIRDRLEHVEHILLLGSEQAGEFETLEAVVESAGILAPIQECEEEAVAALVYTGGTTGLPKGVVLTQKAIVSSILRLQLNFASEPNQSYLSIMPLFHIGSMPAWAAFLPSGGTTYMMRTFDPGAVNQAIFEHKITSFGGVPTMFGMMLSHPDFRPELLRDLRLLLYGAAPMPPDLLLRLMDVCPDLRLVHNYAMTESTATATHLAPHFHQADNPKLLSVGQADVGVEVEIRDPEKRKPLATGQVGEIWLRSDSLLREYWNRPEQTADSLVDGWYRTGDAGRLDEDGFLFLADRVKDMIISGGENIYSLEVENAISSHEDVDQVAVIAQSDPVWGEVPHAFIVTRSTELNPDIIRDHIKNRIAKYKHPKQWTFQSEPLPLSAAGKILKTELRKRV